MADSPKSNSSGDDSTSLLPVFIGIVALALFVLFGSQTLFDVKFLNVEEIFRRISDVAGPAGRTLMSKQTWVVVSTISATLSFFFLVIIVFSIVRLREIQINDKIDIENKINIASKKLKEKEDKVNSRWVHILNLTASENETEWRLAIIEADSMLDDFLKKKGYFGQTMADRLKSAKEGDAFFSVNNAFEAHNVRNKIAHEGVNFSLSQMETRRVMRLYESVFEEFGIL